MFVFSNQETSFMSARCLCLIAIAIAMLKIKKNPKRKKISLPLFHYLMSNHRLYCANKSNFCHFVNLFFLYPWLMKVNTRRKKEEKVTFVIFGPSKVLLKEI